MVSILNALALAVIVTAAGPPANQSIPEGELQRFTYVGRYPLGCQEATVTANQLRAKPTTDIARLHAAAQTYHACATSAYGAGSSTLRNQAYFNTAAALLLAARNEAPGPAKIDATDARTLAQGIVDYRRPRSVSSPGLDNDPSVWRTDAGRIARDASALLASIAGTTPA